MDVIASTAFGLEVDSQKDKNNTFVKMAEKAFKFNLFRPLVFVLCKLNTGNDLFIGCGFRIGKVSFSCHFHFMKTENNRFL